MTIEKTALHTTLTALRDHNVCATGYVKLTASLGEGWPMDKPINLLDCLKSNPVEDVIWALRATTEDSDMIARLIAADCAESAIHIYEAVYPEDRRPREAIEMARRYADGLATANEMAATRAAAWAAAWAAAGDAAGDAAWQAAWAAEGDAAGAAEDAEREKQIEILKKYLATDEE